MSYKINKNRPKISSEEIAKRKAKFDDILNTYKQNAHQTQKTNPVKTKNLFLKKTAITSAVIIPVTILIIWFAIPQNQQNNNTDFTYRANENSNTQKELSTNIIPPFASHTPQPFVIKINPNTQNTFNTNKKIQFTIPENAFIDKNNQPITDSIRLEITEYHTIPEIILSGIPMDYDSTHAFESAGMFKIEAFAENASVILNNKKNIAVSMLSNNSDDKFNIYCYNDNTGKWIHKGKDNIEVIDNKTKAGAKDLQAMLIDTTLQSIEKEILNKPNSNNTFKQAKKQYQEWQSAANIANNISKPQKPEEKSKNGYVFTIDVDYNQFPELKTYSTSNFEIIDKSTFDKKYFAIEWDDISIKRNENKSYYNLMISNSDQTHTFVVKPVLSGKSYTEAMAVFDKQYAQYQAQLNKRKKAETHQKKQYDSILNAIQTERIAYNQKQLAKWNEANKQQNAYTSFATLLASPKNMQNEEMVIRSFEINNLGVWNIDCPISYPENIIKPKFVCDNNKKLNLKTIYLISNELRLVYRFNAKEKFSVNPDENYTIWALSDKEELYYMLNNNFDRQAIKDKNVTINLKPYTGKKTALALTDYFKMENL